MKKILKILKALGDTQRLRIIALLSKSELCVCEVQGIIGFTPATISQHLSLLAEAGLLKSRKFQKWVYYSIDWENLERPVKRILLETLKEIVKDKLIAEDLKKLQSLKKINTCTTN